MNSSRSRALRALVVAVTICTLVASVCAAQQTVVEEHKGVQTAGDIGQIALPLIAAAITLESGQGLPQVLYGLVTSTAITHALKWGVDSERPNGGAHSMPSAHTSSAFTGATLIHRQRGWRWGVPAYGAAAFVGWSRVESNQHRWADVGVGALIGVGTGWVFGRWLAPAPPLRPILSSQASPTVAPNVPGQDVDVVAPPLSLAQRSSPAYSTQE